MKRLPLLMLCLLLIMSLCACTASNAVYTVEKGGRTFTVDPSNNTISDGTHAYAYTFSGNAEAYDITIRYPNGASYYWTKSGFTGHGGWSDDYDETTYTSGDTLCDVITQKAPKPSNPGKFFAALLILAIGAFNAAAPRAAWHLQYGWRFKNAEPSDAALTLNRIVGVLAVLAAVILIFC